MITFEFGWDVVLLSVLLTITWLAIKDHLFVTVVRTASGYTVKIGTEEYMVSNTGRMITHCESGLESEVTDQIDKTRIGLAIRKLGRKNSIVLTRLEI